ncbi:MAG: hypothetical protein F4227_06845 [Gammaproteobacteria bacterium]|nr:hypothetical protein [Gammaproteobacteria bacterium]
MPVLNVRAGGVVENDKGERKELHPAEALRVRGPCVEATLTYSDAHQQALANTEKEIRSIGGVVMFDTGASFSCFDQHAANTIGLPIVGRSNLTSASHSNTIMPVYNGKLVIPGLNINSDSFVGANLASQGLIALIGRDVLRAGTLFYNGSEGTICF